MNQSKKQSLLEVCTNTSIGMLGSWIITMLIIYTVQDKTLAATLTVFICTIWSLLRGYLIRRYFNTTC